MPRRAPDRSAAPRAVPGRSGAPRDRDHAGTADVLPGARGPDVAGHARQAVLPPAADAPRPRVHLRVVPRRPGARPADRARTAQLGAARRTMCGSAAQPRRRRRVRPRRAARWRSTPCSTNRSCAAASRSPARRRSGASPACGVRPRRRRLQPAVPAADRVPAVPRVTVALTTGDNPKLIVEAYFALTSNTVQFGADASLYAAAYGFSIEGNVGFDVLIQLWPPHFIAEFQAGVQLKRGPQPVQGRRRGHARGPDPAAGGRQGDLRHPVVGRHRRVRQDPHLGRRRQRRSPLDAAVRGRRRPGRSAQLAAELPDAAAQLVGLRRDDRPDQILLHPLGRWRRQGVVPLRLDRDIDRVGGFVPTGDRRFAITSVAVGGDSPTTRPVLDEFPDGQLFDITDAERLAAPAFERWRPASRSATTAYRSPGAAVRSPFGYKRSPSTPTASRSRSPSRCRSTAPLVLTLAGLGAAARATFRDAADPLRLGAVARRAGAAARRIRRRQRQRHVHTGHPGPATTWATWTEATTRSPTTAFEPGAVLVLAAQEATAVTDRTQPRPAALGRRGGTAAADAARLAGPTSPAWRRRRRRSSSTTPRRSRCPSA